MFPQGMLSAGISDMMHFAAAQGTDLSKGWVAWPKPVGKDFIFMHIQGSGGGGGGGFQAAAGNPRGGSGGGGTGQRANLLLPSCLLPDILYIRVGQGGARGIGGTTPTVGGTGIITLVAFHPLASSYAYLASVSGGVGGGVGTSSSAGTGGIHAGQPGSGWGSFGLFSSTNDIVQGGIGGVPAGANAGTFFLSNYAVPVTGGTGSGGVTTTDFAGGLISNNTTIMPYPSIPGGSAGGGDGRHGYNYGASPLILTRRAPFFCTGGTGGGTSNSGQGGNGGDGAWGCGGGAGGPGAIGGNGGEGGDGYIIIGAF